MPDIKACYKKDGPDIKYVGKTLEIHHRHPSPREATTKDIVHVMVCLGFLKQNKMTTSDLRFAYAKTQIDASILEDSLLLQHLVAEKSETMANEDKERALELKRQALAHEKEKFALEKVRWKFEKRKNKAGPVCVIL